MIDLTKITFEQANKIEVALLQLENHFKENIKCWSELATDKAFSEQARETFSSNAKWWAEVHNLIYEDKEVAR